MRRFINSLCKSLGLLVPAFLCLYVPIWYSLNLFLAISLTQDGKGFLFGLSVLSLATSLVLFLIFIGLWRLVLKIFWSKPPSWIYPQSWKSVFTGWAIASLCLIIAMLFEPRLWSDSRLLFDQTSSYANRLIDETLGKTIAIWLFCVTGIYLFKK
jgi:amino acid transporter